MSFSAADFIKLVSAYGADEKRWPEDRRAEALAFVQKHDTAKDILAEHGALDALLDTLEAPGPSDVLRAHISKSVKSDIAVGQLPASNDNRPTGRVIFGAMAASLLAAFVGYSVWQAQPVGLPSDAQIIASIEIDGLSDEDVRYYAGLEDDSAEMLTEEGYADLMGVPL